MKRRSTRPTISSSQSRKVLPPQRPTRAGVPADVPQFLFRHRALQEGIPVADHRKQRSNFDQLVVLAISRHLRMDEATGRAQPLPETGRFHVAILHLNRPALVALRLRRLYELLMDRKRLVQAENPNSNVLS